jgi:hypothetical protein
MTIFVFLHRPYKVSVFGETLQTYLDYRYVNEKKIGQFFFDITKYVFWVEGAYAPGSQFKFPNKVD